MVWYPRKRASPTVPDSIIKATSEQYIGGSRQMLVGLDDLGVSLTSLFVAMHFRLGPISLTHHLFG